MKILEYMSKMEEHIEKAEKNIKKLARLLDKAMPYTWSIFSRGKFFEDLDPYSVGCPHCEKITAQYLDENNICNISFEDYKFTVYFYIAVKPSSHEVKILDYEKYLDIKVYHVYLKNKDELNKLINKLKELSLKGYVTEIIGISDIILSTFLDDKEELKQVVEEIEKITEGDNHM